MSESSYGNGVATVNLADRIKDVGLLFLDMNCGALHGVSSMQDLPEKGNTCVLAYDGEHAAILMREEGVRIFCQEVSPGLYDLG